MSSSDSQRLAALSDRLIGRVIAPFLLSFVWWVIQDARRQGIRRLYFVSRDGQILLKIAERCFADSGIEFRYLYGSRQAWYSLPITDLDLKSFDWLLSKHTSRSVRDLLGKLGLRAESLETELDACGLAVAEADHQLTDGQLDDFWRLLRMKPVRERLETESASRRQAANRYFAQQGLMDEQGWAVVDVGWTLGCQKALNETLRLFGRKAPVTGYYLGVKRGHVPADSAGPFRAFLSEEEGCAWPFRQGVSFVIEEVFTMADHPSTTGYAIDDDGSASPVFGRKHSGEVAAEFASAYQVEVVRCCAEACAKLNTPGEWSGYVAAATARCRRFFENPAREEAEAIAWVPVISDQSHEAKHGRRLASPLRAGDIARIVGYFAGGQKGRFEDPLHAWYVGSAALSAPWVRGLFFLLRICRALVDRGARGGQT